jgi:hypothetical protein
MNPLFPYANILTGALILIVGFLFHPASTVVGK